MQEHDSKPLGAPGQPPAVARAFVRMIGVPEAMAMGGPLADVYMRMRSNASPRPAVYSTPSGDAPNIVRCHSLEPEGLLHAFGLSNTIHWGDRALPWATREMINTVTSQSNDCFY